MVEDAVTPVLGRIVAGAVLPLSSLLTPKPVTRVLPAELPRPLNVNEVSTLSLVTIYDLGVVAEVG